MSFVAAFVGGLALCFLATVQMGDVAIRRWRALAWAPLLLGASVLGMGGALEHWTGAVGYIVGGTAGDALALLKLRHEERSKR